MENKVEVLTGFCPNPDCQTQIFFPTNSQDQLKCIKCFKQLEPKQIKDVQPVTDHGAAIRTLLQTYLNLRNIPDHVKVNSEFVKVKGISNYSAKLISPLLTKYGLHKKSKTVKLLSEMGQRETFDCSLLSDRAFLIEPENLRIKGYGKIDTIAEYLKDILQEIYKANNGEENILPIYVDSDGHCLLHAISRALVGREIFWHPLLTNLGTHFNESNEKYKIVFHDFIEDEEWADIIAETDPNFLPKHGEMRGLRNIHIFGLANCLHRPIILIDSAEGLHSKGDYCAVFLPYFIPIKECKDSFGILNKPILISWSNKGRNHFVPLVGIQGKQLPKFPAGLLPKVWGLPQHLISSYIDFDKGCCIIGGNKSLSDSYLLKLITSMENHFKILKGISPSVVTDVYQHIISKQNDMNVQLDMVTETAYSLVKQERLHKCLLCQSVMDDEPPCPLSWLEPGGKLYDIAIKTHKTLKDGYHYRFPDYNNIVCSYNEKKNKLNFLQDISALKCKHCNGVLRVVKLDGSVANINGDQLPIPANKNSKCGCGFKHYWDGKHYDNLPVKVPIKLEWNNVKKTDFLYWFQYENDEHLNSNAFELAQNLVQKYFPGEFGSERLVEKVVDQIFCFVLDDTPKEKSIACAAKSHEYFGGDPASTLNKIILRGAKSKTIHKEELNASKTEEVLRKKIEHHATVKQKRLSASSPQRVLNITPEKLAEIKIESKKLTSNVNKKDCKVRISMIGGKNETYVITENTTLTDIESFVEEKFHVCKEEQLIKMGFPPKTLTSFNITELKHGDRLVVHIRKKDNNLSSSMDVDVKERYVSSTTEPQKINTKENIDLKKLSNKSEMGSLDFIKQEYKELLNLSQDLKNLESKNAKLDPDFNDIKPTISNTNNEMLSNSLFSLIDTYDLWEWACTHRQMFQHNGLFYKRAFHDLGQLRNEQHITLPCFPQKVLVYDEKVDELLLCLGKTHTEVKVLSKQELLLAHNCFVEKEKPSANANELELINTYKTNFQSFTGQGYSLASFDDLKQDNNKEHINVMENEVNLPIKGEQTKQQTNQMDIKEEDINEETSSLERSNNFDSMEVDAD